ISSRPMSCAVATEAQHAAARAAITLPIGNANPNDLVMDSSSNASRGSSMARPHSTPDVSCRTWLLQRIAQSLFTAGRSLTGNGNDARVSAFKRDSPDEPKFDAHGTDFQGFPEAANRHFGPTGNISAPARRESSRLVRPRSLWAARECRTPEPDRRRSGDRI